MSSDRIPMTRAGYDKLKAEVDHLESVEMPKLAQRVASARSEGDLSENAEYHGARESQGLMQAKINLLRDKLARAVIVERAKEANEELLRACIALGGSVDVRGHVTGSVRANGGNVVLRSTAVVDGDASALGGTVTHEPGASVGGRPGAPTLVGLVFGPSVIWTVGSVMARRGRASGSAASAMVSPMVTDGMPGIATTSPARTLARNCRATAAIAASPAS